MGIYLHAAHTCGNVSSFLSLSTSALWHHRQGTHADVRIKVRRSHRGTKDGATRKLLVLDVAWHQEEEEAWRQDKVWKEWDV